MQKRLYRMAEGEVYRPPSEARSLIIRVTTGCSWNKCTFCGTFRDRKFRARKISEITEEAEQYYPYFRDTERIFLADGNALVLPTRRLLEIFAILKSKYKKARRIAVYGGPKDILRKPKEDLKKLRDAGLGIVYIGLESGSDEVLKRVCKGATAKDFVECARKVRDAGISLSVIAIAGLGGAGLSREHAIETGKVLSAMDPQYIGILTLMVVDGTELAEEYRNGRFKLVDEKGILGELRLMVENLNLKDCIFRANHASNYLPIGGTLPEEKDDILAQIDMALSGNGPGVMRPEWARGL